MENRSLFVDNERCFTATRGCKVEFFIFSSSNAFSKLPYIIDDTYISEISLGNISIQPMFLSDENHIKMVTVDRFIFADYDPITLRDDIFHQLYSMMEDRARKVSFLCHNSLKIYNESVFDVSATTTGWTPQYNANDVADFSQEVAATTGADGRY